MLPLWVALATTNSGSFLSYFISGQSSSELIAEYFLVLVRATSSMILHMAELEGARWVAMSMVDLDGVCTGADPLSYLQCLRLLIVHKTEVLRAYNRLGSVLGVVVARRRNWRDGTGTSD